MSSKLRTEIGKKIYCNDSKIEDRIVTWYNYDWGAGDNPTETSVTNYSIVQHLRQAIGNKKFGISIKIGAAYSLDKCYRRFWIMGIQRELSGRTLVFEYNNEEQKLIIE